MKKQRYRIIEISTPQVYGMKLAYQVQVQVLWRFWSNVSGQLSSLTDAITCRAALESGPGARVVSDEELTHHRTTMGR